MQACAVFSFCGKEVGEISKAGRPPKWTNAEEMQAKIDAYFENCKGHVLIGKDGNPAQDKYGRVIVVESHPPTVTGLALSLGFASRQSLLNYQGKKEFLDTITRAKARVEEYTEGRLFDRDGVGGAKFSLEHNFGWQQEQNVEVEDLSKVEKEVFG